MADLDLLLAPIGERFGEDKRKQVEEFLRLQAQIGIKSKALVMTHDEWLCPELAGQVTALRGQMDDLRCGVGAYCTSYVRSILPPGTETLRSRLGQSLESPQTLSGPRIWKRLGERGPDFGRQPSKHDA